MPSPNRSQTIADPGAPNHQCVAFGVPQWLIDLQRLKRRARQRSVPERLGGAYPSRVAKDSNWVAVV